ncbi:MAG: rRNA maturation RNase YbeY [Plectolyngbya sp. WJT66-NPBG17]|jgi:probable rRNA maturation factor|nr:rRNA maturation RNase YbeY [Plectolyngbya sp. WJT66-NPBG17]MBW4524812.1 rRNA maturation RNase YbeY [Phormidium tanganyikae FI6-MK23]
MQIEVSVQDCFHQEQPIQPETWEIWFSKWLELINPMQDEQPLHPHEQYELSLRLTDDREIQSLNQNYRFKDQPTDVLAFASLEVDYPQIDELEAEPLYLGDIVISVETADRQAPPHNLETELAWLAAHGLLHLLGWDHPDDASLLRMLDQQQILLHAVGLEAKR